MDSACFDLHTAMTELVQRESLPLTTIGPMGMALESKRLCEEVVF
jgi:hypothetical protein